MKTEEHYENHLSNYYSWINGGHEDNINKNKQFFESQRIIPFSTKAAIDLGAGSGFQSIPLSQLGFKVTSIDFCEKLLNEIDINKFNIEIIEDNILNFENYADRNPELIVCMGDTLTHLPDINSVIDLIDNSYKELITNGKLVLTFRDLTFELKGIERFIPVRNEQDRIFTCFLEYSKEHIDVYDIVSEKNNGEWVQKISSYKKIKIYEDQIKEILNKTGFQIEFFKKKEGLITILGIKK